MVQIERAPETANRAELLLVRAAVDLGATETAGPLTLPERFLAARASQLAATSEGELAALRQAILAGKDPLGDRFCEVRTAVARRATGAFYTPQAIVEPMLDWVLARNPVRVVDPGCGSGRFAAGVVRRSPHVKVVAVDTDPLATLLIRAALAVLGTRDAQVINGDYIALFSLPLVSGRTAFVGNPPYVRHHDLAPAVKIWGADVGRQLGVSVSGLSGLHAHFYLASAIYAEPGDIGCFVTSAEWLDVGYGSAIRELLLGLLGGQALHLLAADTIPFDDAMATAVITCFEVGSQPALVRTRLVTSLAGLGSLDSGDTIDRDSLIRANRWTPLIRRGGLPAEAGHTTPLRELARVHRGVVTGANGFFILTRSQARSLGLMDWCRPAITRAEEVLHSGGIVRDSSERKVLLDIPADIDRAAHPKLDAYLWTGEVPRNGKPPVADGYIASRRRPWWRLGTPPPPPIVVSYMARRPPVFALNPDGLVLVNIAHGLYPVRPLGESQLQALVAYLNRMRESFRGGGRTYHGGLEKFEPSELEALLIPGNGPWNLLASRSSGSTILPR